LWGSAHLYPTEGVGTAKVKEKQEIWLSYLIEKLNEIFATDNLTDKGMLNYAEAIRGKLLENQSVVTQKMASALRCPISSTGP